jgi:hypothetical protein
MSAGEHPTQPVIDAAPALAGDQAALALTRAVDGCIIAISTLEARLGPDRPPYTAATHEGMLHYGPGDLYDLWIVWRAIARLQVAWDASREPAFPPARRGTTQ